MRELIASHGGQIELIALCPHRPDAACLCRKPKPGMLIEISTRMGVDPGGVPFVGDSLGDVQAARSAGMRPWLVETGKGRHTVEACGADLQGVAVFPNLAAAVDELLCTSRPR
jgi:D-glycero-D-manno-heptose 1,7-bisphosphate phosphatase